MNAKSQNIQKKNSALAALKFIEQDIVLGLGSGSTVHCFIDELACVKQKIEAVVVTSVETEKRVKALSIPVWDLNSCKDIAIYIDGADEIDANFCMIKGGGGALTREKILATVAKKFVCIVDQSKEVDLLGSFPIAVEVIPMARSLVARAIVDLGGQPVWREGFITDNGNVILDIFNMHITTSLLELEMNLNNIPGVVANGIFAARTADTVLVGTDDGVVIKNNKDSL